MLGAVSSGVALNSLQKFSFARLRPDLGGPCRAGLHPKLPKWPRHNVSHDLFDIRSPARPNKFLDLGPDLFHDARRAALTN